MLQMEGSLEIIPGDCVGPSDMVRVTERLLSEYRVTQIVMDLTEGGSLVEAFGDRIPINSFRPYARYQNAPCKLLCQIVELGDLQWSAENHDELLWRWQCSNLGYKNVDKYLMPRKLIDSEKIDNFSALIYALAGLTTPQERVEPSTYATQGIFYV
jgi:phage terminase large subunit-like protein